ncbi:MAG: DNA (cytosine-5-)-methyltransferase, partial [Rhizobiales bacterium]|nr:DNA (cytosine-5-)-methyltransferase [Hyphomicrobiales bacterium]
MKNISIDISEIAIARKTLAITQKQAASYLSVSERTWQQWETGQRGMRSSYWELFLIKTDYKPKNSNKIIFSEFDQKDIRHRQQSLAKITHETEQLLNRNKKYKFIDLFAGIGGIRKAFESVGGGCVFSSEIDPFAQFTYYTNFGVVPYGDICKLEQDDIPKHDILCGGFPCQPFSHIGKREGFAHPTQGTMYDEILKIIDSKQPRVVFLENVPGILNHDAGNTLNIILRELEDRNYDCTHTILNSSDFGVPQNRKRFYLVCFLDDGVDFKFPKPPMQKSDIGDFIEKNVKGYTISKRLQKSYLFKKDDGRPNI